MARVPLWQETQFPVTPLWSKVAGFQAVVRWQLSQRLSLVMCPAFFPVALVPLWHEKQLPTTCAWSTRVAGFQADVEWQDSQLFVVATWPSFFPAACMPLWHEAQLPAIPAWLKFAGRHATVVWQVWQSVPLVM